MTVPDALPRFEWVVSPPVRSVGYEGHDPSKLNDPPSFSMTLWPGLLATSERRWAQRIGGGE